MTDTVRVPAYTEAMGEAGDAYIRSVAFDGRYHLPAQFRWHELLSAMLAASPQGEGSSADADTHRASEGAVLVPRSQLETLLRSLARNTLLPGEGEALINCWIRAHDLTPPAMIADHIGDAPGWRDIATAPRDGTRILATRRRAR